MNAETLPYTGFGNKFDPTLQLPLPTELSKRVKTSTIPDNFGFFRYSWVHYNHWNSETLIFTLNKNGVLSKELNF